MGLIDADALTEKSWDADTRCGYVQVVDAGDIDDAPTIDADPVRHGHWEYVNRFYQPTCSVCNLEPLTPGYVGDVNFYERHFKYCPHCGAKMDGGY